MPCFLPPTLPRPTEVIHEISPRDPSVTTVSRSGIRVRFPSRKGLRSFTLVEMLVVLAIMAILAALSVAAFNAIVGAGNVVSSAYNVSDIVELARNEAITRQSYVWLGCSNFTSPGASGVVFAAVSSIDGSTNSAQTNLMGLSQPLHVNGMVLTDWNALKAATRGTYTNTAPKSVSTNTAGISFQDGPAQFNGTTITFTPRGEALLKGAPSPTDGYDLSIDISLRQTHGASVAANADDAAVVIDGATGNPSIVRLQ